MSEPTLVQKFAQKLAARKRDSSEVYVGHPDFNEAELILEAAVERVTGKLPSRFELLSLKDESSEAADLGRRWIQRRLKGEPVQQIIERCSFLGHRYWVTQDVLIPRPETEFLVDNVIRRLKAPVQGLEIGIGSGVISIELLLRFPSLRMTATEASSGAMACAHKNAVSLLGEIPARERLQILKVDDSRTVFPEALSESGKFDFLISNPPYLSPHDVISEETRRFEPESSLFPASTEPSYFYEKIAQNGMPFLKPDAGVFLEVPHERASEIRLLFSEKKWRDIEILNDLTERPRVLVAVRADDIQRG